MSRKRDRDSVHSFQAGLHTQAPREQLAALAGQYLQARRPYLDQMRELSELSGAHPRDTEQREAGHQRLEELSRSGEWARTHDAVAEALYLDGPRNDRDFLVYELLRQSTNPYEECWVLTDWEENITPPLPAAVRHLIGQAVARSPEIQYVADRAHWLDHEARTEPR